MPIIKAKEYPVVVSQKVFGSISAFIEKKGYSSYFILCDENTLQNCLPLLITACPQLAAAQIIEIESGEKSKTIEICASIWETLLENNADKRTLLINLGGGVVSDLGGFSASVYKRGIDFINIPTSLLAMADASIGGKTGIDFSGIKNAVGSFALPRAVFVNPGFLATLPERHFKNGLAEIFKIALVSDKKFWKELNTKQQAVEKLVSKCITLKNKIVLKDPFDKGRRKILNFGHTLGHALEALTMGSTQELLHGEAVVAGMLLESHVAFQKKLITKKTLSEISAALQKKFSVKSISHLQSGHIMELLLNDKKTIQNKLRLSLITGIGSCKVDLPVTAAQVKKAISYCNQLTA